MDIMILTQFIVVMFAIVIGARLGGVGIGLAGGLGTLVLTMGLHMPAGKIPIDVILIIMAVIMAIAAMQLAGGMDWLVQIVENLLRKHPSHITFLAPIVTYCMTILAGTGHTAYSSLPVIAEVAKEQGIRPSRPLSIAVVASQIAITASPVSAAVVVMAGMLDPLGVGYLQLLAICIPSTFIACMIVAFICNFLGKDLKDDPVYQERLAKGLVAKRGSDAKILKPGAKVSVIVFLIAVICVTFYAIAISGNVGLIKNPPLSRDYAIILFMMSAGMIIVVLSKIDAVELVNMGTFKSGMSACICVLGVAWLGDTFVSAHIESIKVSTSALLETKPWLLAVALYFASALLYSQAATTKAIYPALFAAGLVSPVVAIASFAAVSALFVLPTYPTLLAAIEMDDTGSTKVGKYVFNHSFMIPGTLTIAIAVLLGFVFAPIVL
ncbi:MAG: anaerobic C4-dicarboxylate transporter [Desulfovibrionaceae bacterium]